LSWVCKVLEGDNFLPDLASGISSLFSGLLPLLAFFFFVFDLFFFGILSLKISEIV
jgi:VIT1/CCC1 family predicted Fe2+/Mn2+ transporter